MGLMFPVESRAGAEPARTNTNAPKKFPVKTLIAQDSAELAHEALTGL
jgi:hypothetical protein